MSSDEELSEDDELLEDEDIETDLFLLTESLVEITSEIDSLLHYLNCLEHTIVLQNHRKTLFQACMMNQTGSQVFKDNQWISVYTVLEEILLQG